MSDKTQAEVVDINNKLVRVYDKGNHGAKFKDLAKQFAMKNGYIVRGDKETVTNAKSKNTDAIVEKAVKEEKAKKKADLVEKVKEQKKRKKK